MVVAYGEGDNLMMELARKIASNTTVDLVISIDLDFNPSQSLVGPQFLSQRRIPSHYVPDVVMLDSQEL